MSQLRPRAQRSRFIDAEDAPHPQHSGAVMRFKLFWHHPGETQETGETYERETSDPEKWSRDIIDWFNNSLRPHERKRIFVRCEVEGEVPPAEHKWMKLTMMTKIVSGGPRHGSNYDSMKCERCGVTGKRYGLGPATVLDSKFKRLKVYKKCCDTLAAIKAGEIVSP